MSLWRDFVAAFREQSPKTEPSICTHPPQNRESIPHAGPRAMRCTSCGAQWRATEEPPAVRLDIPPNHCAQCGDQQWQRMGSFKRCVNCGAQVSL
jgi:DNA-directed RNA polymerase subunit RPC12/RpoP